jgi:hypothetical protein
MVSRLFFYQLVLVVLVWLCLMLQWAWPSDPATGVRRLRSLQAHGQSATVRPHPLQASSKNFLATPVSTAMPLTPSPHRR